MNLLDLSAVAIPTGFQQNGLPFGITVCAPAFSDVKLLDLANQVQQKTAKKLGATQLPFTQH
jgi:allophanate hydrolase